MKNEESKHDPFTATAVSVSAWHELKTMDVAGRTHVLLGAEIDYTSEAAPFVRYVDLTEVSRGIERCSLTAWKLLPDLPR